MAWVITWMDKHGRAGIGRVKFDEQRARKIAHDLNYDHGPLVTYKAMDENKLSGFYVIGWKMGGRVRTGSVILTRERAQAEVDKMNLRSPNMRHRVVPCS